MKNQTIWLILIASSVLVAGFFPVHVLQVEDQRKEKLLWIRTLQPGERFSLMYRHSVELCRVWDRFRIDEEYRIILYETEFGSSNTGLPSVLESGERFTRGEKTSRIFNMRRILPAIETWVNQSYENTLELGNQRIPLSKLAGDTLLRLHIRKITRFELTFHQMAFFFNDMMRR